MKGCVPEISACRRLGNRSEIQRTSLQHTPCKEMRFRNLSSQSDCFQDCWVASVLQYEIVKTAGLIHGTTLSCERERGWVLIVFTWHMSSRSQAFAKPRRTLVVYWLYKCSKQIQRPINDFHVWSVLGWELVRSFHAEARCIGPLRK